MNLHSYRARGVMRARKASWVLDGGAHVPERLITWGEHRSSGSGSHHDGRSDSRTHKDSRWLSRTQQNTHDSITAEKSYIL